MHSPVRLLLAVALLGLDAPCPASASSVLFTAPVQVAAPNDFVCLAVNIGTKDVQLSVDVIDNFGEPVPPHATFGLTPMGQASVTVDASKNPRFCQFSILKGSKKWVRTNACVRSGGSCIATSEAH